MSKRYKEVTVRFERGIHDEIVMVTEEREADTLAELFGPKARKDIDMCGSSTYDEPGVAVAEEAPVRPTILTDADIEANIKEREREKEEETALDRQIGFRLKHNRGQVTLYAVDRFGEKVPSGSIATIRADGSMEIHGGVNASIGLNLTGSREIMINGDHDQILNASDCD
ncbi:MAG: hypothetical protein CMJ75_18925 [Planctomycetaceae bacterium]|nr:hypothetical protein [Planctomycetaceae bacterium]